MRIGVISDTHIPDRILDLPAEISDAFHGVDLILHAGDICVPSVLDKLRAIAPVVAVQGNRDQDALPGLPLKTVVTAGPWRIGLIHGTRSRSEELPDRMRYLRGDHRFLGQRSYVRQVFAQENVHCIVFGHTHQVCQETQDGILLFNPGGVVRSPGGGPSSVAILEIGSAGITPLLLPLRHLPDRYTLLEEMRRALLRKGKSDADRRGNAADER